MFGPALACALITSSALLTQHAHTKTRGRLRPLTLRSFLRATRLSSAAPALATYHLLRLRNSSTAMRLSSLNPLNLTLVLVTLITLATLAQPASASSLYHETCTGACNGAYAHCCAHVTGVIGRWLASTPLNRWKTRADTQARPRPERPRASSPPAPSRRLRACRRAPTSSHNDCLTARTATCTRRSCVTCTPHSRHLCPSPTVPALLCSALLMLARSCLRCSLRPHPLA